MAPSIVSDDVVQGKTFLPEQIFVFGGFVLRANSFGHLEQIESYAPGHQVRFGSLNYTTDIRGDLIFDGFEPMSGAPADTELDRLSIFEFNAADIFQHSPLGDVLNSLKNLSLEEDSQPNYVRFELEADDEEFCSPPAAVDDLTDVLDYGSEDIDGMDDDADKE